MHQVSRQPLHGDQADDPQGRRRVGAQQPADLGVSGQDLAGTLPVHRMPVQVCEVERHRTFRTDAFQDLTRGLLAHHAAWPAVNLPQS